jgi:hypothetical protein
MRVNSLFYLHSAKSMKKNLLFAAVFFVCVAGFASARGQELTDLNFLREGGYTLIFRHSSAPGGLPPAGTGNDGGGSVDSLWWFRCDPNVARQLSAAGRNEALTIGQTLKRLNIKVSRLAASEFCRCYETAILFNLGLPITFEPGLTMTLYNNEIRRRAIDSLARPMPPQSTNTILVTHGITFGDSLYDRLSTLAWSDAAVYRNRPDARPDFLGFIRAATWRQQTVSVKLENGFIERSRNDAALPKEITVSPNPASETLSLSAPEASRVRIVNALGQIVFDDQTLKAVREVNCEDWAQGSYTIIFSNTRGTVSRNFVKRR